MGVGNYVNKFSYLHIADLCKHMKKNAVLNDIPVVRRQHVLASLVEYSVEHKSSVFALSDVESHAVSAGVKSHFAEVVVVVYVCHNSA